MDGARAFLRQLDDAWEHQWESLMAALDGVTEEEAAFQAPCYAGEEREEGWPLPGSIHWQVAHVTHCKRHYTDLIRRRGQEERPPVPNREPDRTFAEEGEALREAHREQREAVAALKDPDLDLVVGNGMPLKEFLAMAIRHDTWHAAQIAVARRLWRTRA